MKRLNDYWLECEKCGVMMISTQDHKCSCNQSERSKREDKQVELPDNFGEIKISQEIMKWGNKFESLMRCSEHGGNVMRDK